MNRHFEDARYYLKRAGETAARGVKAELEPIRERYRDRFGEDEPEPDRADRLRRELAAFRARLEEAARGRLDEYRHGNA